MRFTLQLETDTPYGEVAAALNEVIRSKTGPIRASRASIYSPDAPIDPTPPTILSIEEFLERMRTNEIEDPTEAIA